MLLKGDHAVEGAVLHPPTSDLEGHQGGHPGGAAQAADGLLNQVRRGNQVAGAHAWQGHLGQAGGIETALRNQRRQRRASIRLQRAVYVVLHHHQVVTTGQFGDRLPALQAHGVVVRVVHGWGAEQHPRAPLAAGSFQCLRQQALIVGVQTLAVEVQGLRQS
ncbi:hypothetical protein D9M68_788230 [compost metagenome]